MKKGTGVFSAHIACRRFATLSPGSAPGFGIQSPRSFNRCYLSGQLLVRFGQTLLYQSRATARARKSKRGERTFSRCLTICGCLRYPLDRCAKHFDLRLAGVNRWLCPVPQFSRQIAKIAKVKPRRVFAAHLKTACWSLGAIPLRPPVLLVQCVGIDRRVVRVVLG
jgi:hypothetical protein